LSANAEGRTDHETALLTNDERVTLLYHLYDALLRRLLAVLSPEGDQPPPTAAHLDIARKLLADHGIKATAMRTTPDVRRGLQALVTDFSTLPFVEDDKGK